MTTTRSLLLLAALLAVPAFGCAADPGKQADDAHDAQLKQQRESQQNQAATLSDARVSQAEADRKAATTSMPSSAPDAKMTETRRVYTAKAAERLDKADARINELKVRVDKAGAKATTASRDSLTTVDTQRAMAKRDLDALGGVSNDDFGKATTNIDADLDTLDGLLKKAGTEVDNIKK